MRLLHVDNNTQWRGSNPLVLNPPHSHRRPCAQGNPERDWLRNAEKSQGLRFAGAGFGIRGNFPRMLLIVTKIVTKLEKRIHKTTQEN